MTTRAPTKIVALLGGAAMLALAHAAAAQDIDAATDADVEGPQAAIVEEEIQDGAAAPAGAVGVGPEAQRTLDAEGGAAPGPGHTNSNRFNDDELAGVTVGEGSPEALAAEAAASGEPPEAAVDGLLTDAQPEAKQNAVQIIPTETDETEIVLDAHPAADGAEVTEAAGDGGGVDDARLLEAFMDMDSDGDLLLTQAELGAWQGWPAGRAPAFGDLDVNGTGVVGFGEYRVWSAIQAGTAEPGS